MVQTSRDWRYDGGMPVSVDSSRPESVAAAVRELQIDYVRLDLQSTTQIAKLRAETTLRHEQLLQKIELQQAQIESYITVVAVVLSLVTLALQVWRARKVSGS